MPDESPIIPLPIETLIRVIFDNGQIGDVKGDKSVEETVKMVVEASTAQGMAIVYGCADNNSPCAMFFNPSKISGLFIGPWPKDSNLTGAQVDPRVLAAIAAQEARKRH